MLLINVLDVFSSCYTSQEDASQDDDDGQAKMLAKHSSVQMLAKHSSAALPCQLLNFVNKHL